MIPGREQYAAPSPSSCLDCATPPKCPDCAAPMVGLGMVHAETCPIGAGADRAVDGDRRWFERHPRAKERVRPVTWAEAAEIGLSTGQLPTGNVRVLQLAPGMRSRYFEDGEA